ncbi:MAG: hypothetical protein MPK62_01730 [Alphaproteobacteria bacterium]|nr:hypothetical protein [Alphaproteobacteria bacterium]MDA8029853.1 hypothetical protein [Alphaproteobacteria bacterium]
MAETTGMTLEGLVRKRLKERAPNLKRHIPKGDTLQDEIDSSIMLIMEKVMPKHPNLTINQYVDMIVTEVGVLVGVRIPKK